MAVHILGIRHHGPGSAKTVQAFLEQVQPDIVLVEGPPEADALLQYVLQEDLEPPVAILAYRPDDLQSSVYYPFASFSPEWQALVYAKKAHIHVRFMDLPLTHWLAMNQENATVADTTSTLNNQTAEPNTATTDHQQPTKTPLHYLAAAAGFAEEEIWWEHMFEQRQNSEEVFTAVLEAMQALRAHFPEPDDKELHLREAWMRKMIRQAEKEMFGNIAVICGAWHAPALVHMPKAKEDNDLLKGLPKVKIETTWIPWTYSRLSMHSGYGAGIPSPGWYEHLWQHPTDDGSLWMAKVAQLFRKEQKDISTAHVIEAVRLANALAALRNHTKAGLYELNEATISVLCNGEAFSMQLIEEQLIVSNKIGTVPAAIPKPPLQVDIEKTQKRLRLPVTADWKDYLLDLRKENDLERSVFLNRLDLLGITWGSKSLVSGKGTFKEQWRLQWDPSFVIQMIEKGVWGNTLEEASNAWLIHACNMQTELSAITTLLEKVIPANLETAATKIADKILAVAAATNDVLQLVSVLPGLVNIIRYGNVRKTDAAMVTQIVRSMVVRICIGLPAACCGVNEETASKITEDCIHINHSIQTLQEQDYLQQWHHCLQQVAYMPHAAAIMRGFAARQLMDAKVIADEPLLQLVYSSLSQALPVPDTAAWLEGFLKGSGTVLLLDDRLWQMLHQWVQQLNAQNFTAVLPLLRRTFSQFTPPERKKLGEKAKFGTTSILPSQAIQSSIDEDRAAKALPIVLTLLGYAHHES